MTALVNELTKSTIDEQAVKQQKALFDQVIPSHFYDNDLQKELLHGRRAAARKGPHRLFIARKGDKPVGAVMEATAPDGYSGAIQLLVGSDFSGTILGTRVTQHHETPGLGDKIETRLSDWILHFADKVIHGEDDTAFCGEKTAASLTVHGRDFIHAARW